MGCGASAGVQTGEAAAPWRVGGCEKDASGAEVVMWGRVVKAAEAKA